MKRSVTTPNSSKSCRTYDPDTVIAFQKTSERFGGLSNMAPGFPLKIGGVDVPTSEALYQACRFPHLPDVQLTIVSQRSPMTAKMKSKPFRRQSREDWDQVKVKIMRWCLAVKLAQNYGEFSRLLMSTGDRPIVEVSTRDDFWGARVDSKGGTLVGRNVLGRLLMELRENVLGSTSPLIRVEPLNIQDFLLFGSNIGVVEPVTNRRDVAQPRLL